MKNPKQIIKKILYIVLILTIGIWIFSRSIGNLIKTERVAQKNSVLVINVTKNENPIPISLDYREIESVNSDLVRNKVLYPNLLYNLIIEEALLGDEDIKELINETLKNVKKVIIKGNIDTNRLVKSLGITQKTIVENKNILKDKDSENITKAGVLLSNKGKSIIIVNLYVDNTSDSNIYDAFLSSLTK